MSSEQEVNHLHTYFLFPVAIDKAAVMKDHTEIWRESRPWFETLDHWIRGHVVPEYATAATQLGGYIDRLYALRNSDAVNRLAMMSVILGIGALVTGYYGMNIPHLATLLQNDATSVWSLVLTSLMAVASLWFIFYIVASNWLDYRASILPHRYRKAVGRVSLRGLRRHDESNLRTPKNNPGLPES